MTYIKTYMMSMLFDYDTWYVTVRLCMCVFLVIYTREYVISVDCVDKQVF